MENVLEVSHLTKTYKRSHLGRTTTSRGVTDVGFEVRRGEVFGLLGLNGSGKTTTLKLILGLLFPTSGQVRLFGHPVPHSESQRRVGYLPEVPYFYRNLTPVEVLQLYGTLSGMEARPIYERTAEVLKLVRMEASARRPMREFSKGMLQRICLAQALLHDPEFLVLDEPVTGLDPLGIRQSRELIGELHKQGKTILFSSHSISELERLATRVAVLSEGRAVRFIDAAEWKQKPGRLEELFIETLQSTGAAL